MSDSRPKSPSVSEFECWVVPRRAMIQGSVFGAAGVVFGCRPRLVKDSVIAGAGDPLEEIAQRITVFIHVHEDNRLRIILDRVEMGQGTETLYAQLAGEIFSQDPQTIDVVHAPAHPNFRNTALLSLNTGGYDTVIDDILPAQMTGGSTSTVHAWQAVRISAMHARARLIVATVENNLPAAERKEAPFNCTVRDGMVHYKHKQWNGSAHLGAMAKFVPNLGGAHENIIRQIVKKLQSGAPQPGSYRYLGKRTTRLDTPKKVAGQARFGMDVYRKDMLHGVLIHYPGARGYVKVRPNISGAVRSRFVGAAEFPGVVDLVPTRHGVVVVGTSYWRANRAAIQLEALFNAPDSGASWQVQGTYDDGPLKAQNTTSYESKMRAKAQALHKKTADKAKLNSTDGSLVTGSYELPFLPHATMEPMNCTAEVRSDKVRIWAPTQFPIAIQKLAEKLTGKSAVVYTTYLGGGFGRRIYSDFATDAIEAAKAPSVAGRALKVVWSRQDDYMHDYYRPAASHQMAARVQKAPFKITSWSHAIVAPSILGSMAGDVKVISPKLEKITGFLNYRFDKLTAKAYSLDPTASEGAKDTPYAKDAKKSVKYERYEPGPRVGFWRSVGHSHTAFATESLVDEMVVRTRLHPLGFRNDALPAGRLKRLCNQLMREAERINGNREAFEQSLFRDGGGDNGVYRGFACHACFNSYAAMLIGVRVESGQIKVVDVYAGIDCGFVLNPEIVEQQIESGVIFGLSAALKQKITVKNGEVEQRSFLDCDPLRIHECPKIYTYIAPSKEAPTGVGEIAVPVVAPALTAAVYRATGKRVRKLPVNDHSFGGGQ